VTLALAPGANANGDVVWVCGRATAPTLAAGDDDEDVIEPGDSATATSILDKYLPATCREGFGAEAGGDGG